MSTDSSATSPDASFGDAEAGGKSVAAQTKLEKARLQAAAGDIPTETLLETGGDMPEEIEPKASTKDTLAKEARKRGLNDSGTKQELADRINEYDARGMHKPEVLYAHEEE